MLHYVLCQFIVRINSVEDIDQLKKTMVLTGTPGPDLLAKITSEEVVTYTGWAENPTLKLLNC